MGVRCSAKTPFNHITSPEPQDVGLFRRDRTRNILLEFSFRGEYILCGFFAVHRISNRVGAGLTTETGTGWTGESIVMFQTLTISDYSIETSASHEKGR